MAIAMDPRKGKGLKGAGEPAPDGPARVVKPGDWGAVPDAGLKGFTMAAFSVPGRAAPKPDPAELRLQEAEKRLRKAEEAHKEALARAGREAEARAAAAEAKGREEGRRDGEKAAADKYNKSVEDLRKGIRGVLEALSREKAAAFLGYEGEAVALCAAAVKKVFEGVADAHAEAALPLLRKAVAALGEVSALTLKINPADFQVIDENRSFWIPVEAGLKDIRIVPDARIPKGACRVESDSTSLEMRASDLADRIAEAFSKVFEAKSKAVRGEEPPGAPAADGDEDMPPAVDAVP
jgi:flagellar biosynthesis/type III secretory pathway protein FliH